MQAACATCHAVIPLLNFDEKTLTVNHEKIYEKTTFLGHFIRIRADSTRLF